MAEAFHNGSNSSQTQYFDISTTARHSNDATEVDGSDADVFLLARYSGEQPVGTSARDAGSSDNHRRSKDWKWFKVTTTTAAAIALVGLLSKRVAAKTRDCSNSRAIRGTKNPGSPA